MGRLVIVVTEGAAPTLLERWMAVGRLPAFSALKAGSTWGPFKSLPVPYEAPALLSAFTGYPPGEHGCFTFWHVHGAPHDGVPPVVLADDISTPLLWQTPAAAKLKVGIVNLFGTHPPRPVNGYLITYPMYPTLRACYPPSLLWELSQAGIGYAHDVSALYTGTQRDHFIALIERVASARTRACLDLLKRDCDLCIFNLTVIDRISHFWWHEVEDEADIDDADTALYRAYRLVDDFLSRLLDALRPTDNLLVFSEFGFGPLKRFVSVNDVLAQAGLLTMLEGQVDPTRTLAMEAVQGTHGINLLRCHEDGSLAAEEAERRLCEVREALLTATNLETGGPLFADVVRGNELYPGSRAAQAPDLIGLPYDERYLPLGHPYWARKVHRHLQTGWHRRNSFWAGWGPRFGSHAEGPESRCEDIASTIAECLGLPPPHTYGRSLTRA